MYSYLDQCGKTKKHVGATAPVYHSGTPAGVSKEQRFVMSKSGRDCEMKREGKRHRFTALCETFGPRGLNSPH